MTTGSHPHKCGNESTEHARFKTHRSPVHCKEVAMSTAVWKGHLTFGLVSIPIKLYRAARAEKVNFRQLHRTWTPSADPAPARAALSGPSSSLQRSALAPSPSA